MGRHSARRTSEDRNDSARNDPGPRRQDGQPGMRAPDGARVLVARSPDRAAELVTALRGAGAEPLLLPLIDFELASDQHSLDVAFDALGAGAYTWLVVSSVTTVQALEAKAAERGTTLSGWLPGSLLVATIGPATRRFLESRGVAVDLAPDRAAVRRGAASISGPSTRAACSCRRPTSPTPGSAAGWRPGAPSSRP